MSTPQHNPSVGYIGEVIAVTIVSMMVLTIVVCAGVDPMRNHFGNTATQIAGIAAIVVAFAPTIATILHFRKKAAAADQRP